MTQFLRTGPIQIYVSDIKKAKKWYLDLPGMKIIKEYPEFDCILMKLDDIEFDIGIPNPKWGKGWDKIKIGGRTPIFFETNNIEQTINKLRQKGISIIEEPSLRPWGELKAVFSDPDGNEFNIIQTCRGEN